MVVITLQCFNNLCCCVFPSSFAAHRASGGEPPQSAQDKARMDKEYLSLMAELGEAPVPSSGGGHTTTHAGGPRASGPNNNQPPPVCSCLTLLIVRLNKPGFDRVLASFQMCALHAC